MRFLLIVAAYFRYGRCFATPIRPRSPEVVEFQGQRLVVKEISKSGFILLACKKMKGGFW